MSIKEIKISINEYNSIDELNNEDKVLINSAKLAADRAYSPYSKFSVGAAVLLANGEIIQGNNQENAAYPSGLCAERVALFYANSKYPDVAVKAIAITAKKNNKFNSSPVPPCGSCRQVMLETETRFKTPIKIILFGENKIQIINKVSDLLPLDFTADFF